MYNIVGDNWGHGVELKHVIENCESSEVIARAKCAKSDFIEMALKAAKYSKFSTRNNILQDVSQILGCNFDDLSFLFYTQTDEAKSTVYKLDLPDYRLRESDVYLEAAE